MSAWPDVPGYRISGELGGGAVAMVYRAEQRLGLRRAVALRVLSVIEMSEDEKAGFERECEALALLDWHPNIVRLFDAGFTSDGRPYLATELLDAGSVAALHTRRPMPVDAAGEMGIQISSALVAAHDAGILHRDIRPSNILIDRTGRYRLADFGIASIAGASRLSRGGITGAVDYLAPEVIMGEKATVQSDVYSLAATMHALTAGVPPFSKIGDESIAVALLRALHDQPIDLREHGAPAWFASVIAAALTKSASARTPTASAFRSQLEHAEAVVLPAARTDEARTVVRGATDGADDPSTDTRARPIEPTTQVFTEPHDPESDPTVRVNHRPETSAVGHGRRGDRRAFIAALAVTAVLLFGGVAYASLWSGDESRSVVAASSTTESANGIAIEAEEDEESPATPYPAPTELSATPTVVRSDTTAPTTTETPAPETSAVPSTTAAVAPATTQRPRTTPPPVVTSPPTTALTRCPDIEDWTDPNKQIIRVYPGTTVTLAGGLTYAYDSKCGRTFVRASYRCWLTFEGVTGWYQVGTYYPSWDGSTWGMDTLCNFGRMTPPTTPVTTEPVPSTVPSTVP